MWYTQKMLQRVVLTAAFVFSLSSPAQKPGTVQRFPAETTVVPEAIKLPADAMQTILSDKSAYAEDAPPSVICQKEDITDATIDAVYRLLCVHVKLSPESNDLLVLGVGDYRGETSVPYWLFHATPKGNVLVLKVRAESLDVLPAFQNGLHAINVEHVKNGSTTIEHFSFDGAKYIQAVH